MNEPHLELQPGSLCHTGENRLPSYRVIHLHEDRVWLRDVSTGDDSVVAAAHCHRLKSKFENGPDAAAPSPPTANVTEPTGPAWPDGTPRP